MSSGQEVGEIFGDGSGPATALLRSPTVLIASIGLWGMNVYFFRVFGIDYIRVLNLDLIHEKEKEERKSYNGGKNVSSNMEHSQHISTSSAVGTTGTSVTDLEQSSNGNIEMHPMIGSSSAEKDSLSATMSNATAQTDMEADDSDSESMINAPLVSVADDSSNNSSGITETKLISLSMFLMLLLHLTSVIWINDMHGSTVGAIFFFYLVVAVGIVLPLPNTQWIRTACRTVFVRALELLNPRCSCIGTGPPRPVPFIDVFFADAMCSLSKVFFDWGMLWILASHYPHPVPASTLSIVVPSCFASLPYIIRARQCLVMYTVGKLQNDPKRFNHVINAIKYSTSLFPLIVSAYMNTINNEDTIAFLEQSLIVLLAINATYSLMWDIMMDWGMMQKPSAIVLHTVGQCAGTQSTEQKLATPTSCINVALRPRLRFGASLSIVILMIDIFLRFSWMLRFYEKHLFPSNDAYILCTQFLEVFRRAMWNLLRVEWENIKQVKAKKSLEKKLATYDEDDDVVERTVSPVLMQINPNIIMKKNKSVIRNVSRERR